MKRKALVRATAALLVAVGVSSCGSDGGGDGNESSNLTYAFYPPPDFALAKNVEEPAVKKIAEATEDGLEIAMQYGDAVGPAADHYKLVQDGVVDLAYVAASYNPDELALSGALSLPGLYSTSTEGAALIDGIFDDVLSKEYKGVDVLAMTTTPTYFLFLKDKAETLADLKGLRIRTPGGAMSDLVNELGMEAVEMPGTEIYGALERGVLDGTAHFWGPHMDSRYFEQTSHVIEVGLGGAVVMTVGNQEAFAGLSENNRNSFFDVWGDRASHSKEWGAVFDKGEKEVKQKLLNHSEHPHSVSTLSAEDTEVVAEASQKVAVKYLDSLKDADPKLVDQLKAKLSVE